MNERLTHASFFSGAGGLDLGLERAGWRTVSFSEINPYASAVLAERWPGVPNLGDITALGFDCRRGEHRFTVPGFDGSNITLDICWDCGVQHDGTRVVEPWAGDAPRRRRRHGADWAPCPEWQHATLWSGGFPCQDLSVAGKRRGMGTHDERADTRSGLAYAFLDLVEQHRPPAILLENVPGLLSSNGGKDFGALLGRLGELGYWWAYRILDAQFFGVPQRRRRVFICALHAGAGFGADSAAAVLSVGARCDGHSQESDEAGTGTAQRPTPGVDIARAITGTSGKRHDDDTDTLLPMPRGGLGGMVGRDARLPRVQRDGRLHPSLRAGGHGSPGIGRDGDEQRLVVSEEADPRRDGASDGLARRLDDREVVGTLTAPNITAKPIDGKRQDGSRLDRIPLTVSALDTRQGGADDNEAQAGHLVYRKSARVNADPDSAETWVDDGLANTLNNFDVGGLEPDADSLLLPLGLDSHRYRCCGNGVVSNVSEWVGVRLARAFTEAEERAA